MFISVVAAMFIVSITFFIDLSGPGVMQWLRGLSFIEDRKLENAPCLQAFLFAFYCFVELCSLLFYIGNRDVPRSSHFDGPGSALGAALLDFGILWV